RFRWLCCGWFLFAHNKMVDLRRAAYSVKRRCAHDDKSNGFESPDPEELISCQLLCLSNNAAANWHRGGFASAAIISRKLKAKLTSSQMSKHRGRFAQLEPRSQPPL